jgi:hypothetical protein
MGAIFGNFGIRRLLDQNQRFLRKGLPTYLRVKNFVDNPAFADMGFQYVPSVTGAVVPVGTTDIPIQPPPSVTSVSMHTIMMAMLSGGQLRAGARWVFISHTWVKAQMSAQWYLDMCAAANLDPTEPRNVFSGPQVAGIVTAKLLLEIVDLTADYAYGETMSWSLSCNASELSNSAVPVTP